MRKLSLTFLLGLTCLLSHSQVRNFYQKPLSESIRDKFYEQTTNSRGGTHSTLRTCHTMEMDSIIRKKYPQLGTSEDFEKNFKTQIRKQANINARMESVVYTIPVIVHVVHNGQAIGVGENITAAQVQSQIDVLNEDFRRKTGTSGFNSNSVGSDVEIEFAPALFDPTGKLLVEPGIHRVNSGRNSWGIRTDIENTLKPQTIWDPNSYFNIWTLKYGGAMIDNLGYAQFPSLSNLTGLEQNGGLAATDGVVCRYNAFGRVGTIYTPYDKGRTVSHEVGHWLGLRHIWGDVTNQCSHPQDYCDDTPKAKKPNFGCPTGTNSCIFYLGFGDGPDMIENYMDYTDDACMNTFTQNQKTRMRSVMEVSPRRKELLSSTVHISTNKPLTFFDADKETVCSGSAITFSDSSKNTPTSWRWDFFNSSGSNVGTFNTKNVSITFNSAGVYDVRLISTNLAGKDTLLKPNYINVVSNTFLNFPFNETVEGTSTFPNWIFYNPDKDITWSETSKASANGTGTWSLVFDNYNATVDLGGKIDAMITNKLNLSTNQNVLLSLDVAYAQFSQQYNDTLVLYYSVDCGETFTPFWFKGGSDLATAPNTTSAFIPTSSQWKTEQISLNFLNGFSSVYIAIANISGWGNNLYLDNVKFTIPNITRKPYVYFNTSNTNVCEGETVQFNDISSYYPTSWTWEFTGGTPLTSSWQNPIVTYNTPGSYDVKLTGSNNFGSDNWLRSNYINVIAKPNINIVANKTIICDGDSIKLKATGGQNYSWYDDREYLIGNGDSIWIYPTKNTAFKVIGENSNGCKSFFTKSISVNSSPEKPIITQSGNSLVTSTISASYKWYSESGIINGVNSNSFSPIANGIYYVIAINSNSCAARSDDFIYNITSIETEKVSAHNQVIVYPNPTKDQLNVELNGYCTLKISSLQGKQFATYQFNNNITIDMSNYSKGLYIFEVLNGNTVQRKTVIVQ